MVSSPHRSAVQLVQVTITSSRKGKGIWDMTNARRVLVRDEVAVVVVKPAIGYPAVNGDEATPVVAHVAIRGSAEHLRTVEARNLLPPFNLASVRS